MDRKAAKELLHIKGWLDRVDEIVERGKDAYLADDLLQEAGDSLMMKLGEAANRLSRLGVLAPDGVEWALAGVSGLARSWVVNVQVRAGFRGGVVYYPCQRLGA
jgi:hypothetical protein